MYAHFHVYLLGTHCEELYGLNMYIYIIGCVMHSYSFMKIQFSSLNSLCHEKFDPPAAKKQRATVYV